MTKLTDTQRGAMHLYFQRLAEALNDAGYDQKALLDIKNLPVPNTQESIKEIWRVTQAQMFPSEDGKISTNNLTTGQVSQVYEVINKAIAQHFGVHVPFPTNEPPMI